ncbi:hypothetical protein CL3_19490 [butyrate-producing bacterium SM4/1]|nr:hypothetical protein CLS_30540 [[Clostridium] cf. saccharolyticum K10]CBL36365.1 hypothetical protein CL3_19490 [butyrate-producing bacterium SM4/1]
MCQPLKKHGVLRRTGVKRPLQGDYTGDKR